MSPTKRTFSLILLVALAAILFKGLSLDAPRIPINHSRAVRRIKELALAEQNYAARHADTKYACKLSDLGEEGLVNKGLASGTVSGYQFEIRCFQGGDQKVVGYAITAVPVTLGLTGEYAFCTDQSGEIWYSKKGLAPDCLALHKPAK